MNILNGLLWFLVTVGCFHNIEENSERGNPAGSEATPFIHGSIVFADSSLEKVIRQALGKPADTLTAMDLLSLTQLEAEGRGIKDLAGIEGLKHLTALNLADNQLREIAPLSSLQQLVLLNLENNHIQDISALKALSHLEHVMLSHNQIQDVSILLDLQGLKSVELSANPLDEASLTHHLTILRERGVEVTYAPTPSSEGVESEPAQSEASWAISFLTTRDSNWEIYVMGVDGSRPFNVTNSSWDEGEYSWSPDGTQIVLTNSAGGFRAINLLNLFTAEWTTLVGKEVSNGMAYPVWLPDGKKVGYCYAKGNPTFVIDTIDGTTDTLDWKGWYPTWSPDGTQVAYIASIRATIESALWGRNADGSNERLLIEGVDWSRPAWSPDGRQLAFAKPDSNYNMEIWVIDADGNNSKQLTHHAGADGLPCWSPDGKQIAFASWQDNNMEICVMGADGSSPVNLTRNGATDTMPFWVLWQQK